MRALADNVRRLRYDYDLTQKELAKKLETTQQTISEVERGLRLPDVVLLCKLSDFFNVSIDDIIYSQRALPNSKNTKNNPMSPELISLLENNKDEINLIIDFLLYQKKQK